MVTLPESTDAREWAKAFLIQVTSTPNIAVDVETMTTWFANAIMAGYNLHVFQTRDSMPEELAEAAAAEREACCEDVCWLCHAAICDAESTKPAVYEEHFNWGKTWVHHTLAKDGEGIVVQCKAAAIHARGEES